MCWHPTLTWYQRSMSVDSQATGRRPTGVSQLQQTQDTSIYWRLKKFLWLLFKNQSLDFSITSNANRVKGSCSDFKGFSALRQRDLQCDVLVDGCVKSQLQGWCSVAWKHVHGSTQQLKTTGRDDHKSYLEQIQRKRKRPTRWSRANVMLTSNQEKEEVKLTLGERSGQTNRLDVWRVNSSAEGGGLSRNHLTRLIRL